MLQKLHNPTVFLQYCLCGLSCSRSAQYNQDWEKGNSFVLFPEWRIQGNDEDAPAPEKELAPSELAQVSPKLPREKGEGYYFSTKTLSIFQKRSTSLLLVYPNLLSVAPVISNFQA